MPDFYPDINDFLEKTDNARSITSKGLEEFIYKVRAKTGMSYDVSSLFVRYLFQEIMNAMLRGDKAAIYGFGNFFISTSKKGKSIRFEPHTSFARKLKNENK